MKLTKLSMRWTELLRKKKMKTMNIMMSYPKVRITLKMGNSEERHLLYSMTKTKQLESLKGSKWIDAPEYGGTYARKCLDENKKQDGPKLMNGKRIKAERAAEPTDVFWENLAVPSNERTQRIFLTYVITTLVLLGSFTANLVIGIIKGNMEEDAKNENGSAGGLYWTFISLINIINGLAVSTINYSLGQIVRYLTNIERQTTYTKHDLSISVKLVFATFINTGLIPLAVNFTVKNWFTQTGLVVDIFFNTVSV